MRNNSVLRQMQCLTTRAFISTRLIVAATILFCVPVRAQTTYFSDDFEGGLGKWLYSGQDWDTISATQNNGSYSITDSPGGNTPNNANVSITTSKQIDLTIAVHPALTFWDKFGIYQWYGENNVNVEVSTNNGSAWISLAKYDGYQSTWFYRQYDLTSYIGAKIKVRFRVVTGGTGTSDGWYVDDVSVVDMDTTAVPLPFTDDFEHGLSQWIASSKNWDTVSATQQSGNNCITDSPVGNSPNYSNASISMLTQIDLTTATHPALTFWDKFGIYQWYGENAAAVEVSKDNGFTWTVLARYDGTQSTWFYRQYDLASFAGSKIKVRFRMYSWGTGTSDGWYIDDVSIVDMDTTAVPLPFTDDFEHGLSQWIASTKNWDTISTAQQSGNNCITDSPEGDSPHYSNAGISTLKQIDLTSAVHPALTFWDKFGIYQWYDENKVVVEVSKDNGFIWTVLARYDGTQSTWFYRQYNLASFAGSKIRVRFRTYSWGTGTSDGWYIDDVSVVDLDTTAVPLPFTDDFEHGLSQWIASTKNWDTISATQRAGNYSITDSRQGNSPHYSNAGISTLKQFDLTSAINPVLSFWDKFSIAPWYSENYANVEVSDDNGFTWKILDRYYGTQSTWTYHQYDLAGYAGTKIKARFRISTGGTGTSEGWYIDDVIMKSEIAVIVTSPNGGEVWPVGSPQAIRWTSDQVNTVNIEYSTNKGRNWQTVVTDIPANLGSYDWTVPNVYSRQCLIRISDSADVFTNDYSNSVFTILPPHASVTGMVFNDLHTDQIYNAGDSAISAVKVVLKDSLNAVVDSTFSDSNGKYEVYAFATGKYSVSEVPDTVWIQNTPGGLGNYSLQVSLGDSLFQRNFGNLRSYRYIHPGAGDWSIAENWQGHVVPGAEQSVTIPQGSQVNVDAIPNDTIRALRIETGGSLNFTPQVGRLSIAQRVHVGSGAALQFPSTSDTTGIVCQSDLINQGTLDPGHSIITFAGNKPKVIANADPSGNSWRNTFYNLEIKGDSTSALGNVRVERTLHLTTAFDIPDTLDIADTTIGGFTGPGKIPGGTIRRAIASGSTGSYRFESESTYVRFTGIGTNPSKMEMTLYPDTLPDTVGATWVEIPSRIDTASNTITADSVTHFSKWYIRIPPKTSASTGGNDAIRRIYVIHADGGKDYRATLSLRYEQREVPSGIDESALRLYRVDESSTPVRQSARNLIFEYRLFQNYPNPFNPVTTISYALAHSDHVTLSVFNTLGQRVAVLVDAQQQAGYYDVTFRGDGLASGVYFYRIQSGSFTDGKKLLLMK